MKFPVNFPVSREFKVETGSIKTACTTTQSCVCGDFPTAGEKPPDGGTRSARSLSVTCDLDLEGSLGPYSLASNSGFPETGTAAARDRFDYRASAEARPRIWRCRDHSAGISQRRATPIVARPRHALDFSTESKFSSTMVGVSDGECLHNQVRNQIGL
jgi:hypothetical protein